MTTKSYISVRTDILLKHLTVFIQVPEENYKDHSEAFYNADKLVKELIDNNEIKLMFNGKELPKELINTIYCDSDDSYDANFIENDENHILPNGIVYHPLK